MGHYDITMCSTPQKFTRLSDPFLFSSIKWYCKLLLITLLIKKNNSVVMKKIRVFDNAPPTIIITTPRGSILPLGVVMIIVL